jgi:hypothetical protein
MYRFLLRIEVFHLRYQAEKLLQPGKVAGIELLFVSQRAFSNC